ncbi:Mbeg1-like protein [Butyrivibrio sp. AE2032]|uniref:Mbeg1-like protein n=1 Tax=Butyrivibrio sp. AE2032 TaxID=1458463 RepID=UPI0009DE4476|nr:Mbeg1-like protein [Butyrivibrio sp. AE2032]
MSNMLDYLAWRGDLSFERDPFNSVDALLLSTLSYVDLAGVVPSPGEGKITLGEASEKFFGLHSEEELAADKSFISFAPALLRHLADSDRFRNAYLLNYINDTDISREIQFAAVEIDTGDGIPFISFRGTDDTIIGWKEDFNLSFMTVPAEEEAARYLKQTMSGRTVNFRAGGHSKGGHLAIYAVAADPGMAERVLAIYNFDGPGFNDDALESERFKNVRPKVMKYIPETSIVGRLLTNTTEPVVVKSSEFGIMQHSPLTWQLEGKEFETCNATDKISDLFDETMTTWLDEMSFEERKVFVDELFSVFEASGCENLSMLTKVGVRGTKAMIGQMRQIRNDSGAKVRTLVKMFFVNINELRGEAAKEKIEESRILSIASGKIKNGKQ